MICTTSPVTDCRPRQRQSTVLLVDDQPIVAEVVRRMVADETDIAFHYCRAPFQAVEMANELQPTVILQDLVMPEIDGLMLVKRFRANPATRETPMIVLSTNEKPITKAEAFSVGANDYVVKLPDRLELLARIRYHSKGYINLLERNEAHALLETSQRHLCNEVEAGARYVQALMPKPMCDRLQIDWRYVPCAALAGDSLGYHWLDQSRLAIYLLDVTGHGVASALLGVSVMNVLRSQSLPGVDFCQPAQVLRGLNETFEMESHGLKCFTIWYGIFDTQNRMLTWAGGGHPAALLFLPEAEPGSLPIQLQSQGPMIGMMPWDEWSSDTCLIPPDSRLYLYSDGAYEIQKADGKIWTEAEFLTFMSQPQAEGNSLMDRLHQHVRFLKGGEVLDDDFSIIEARL